MNSLSNGIHSVYIDTGNLLESNSLKRNASLLPTEEFFEGLTSTLADWNLHQDSPNKQNITSSHILDIVNLHCGNKVNSSDRENYRVIIKVFTNDEYKALEDAIQFLLNRLDTTYIDSLIVSLPSPEISYTLDLKPYWNCLEEIVNSSKVKMVGISDLDTNQLVDLYNYGKRIKPGTNQINLESCCVIPEEMREFAKLHHIKILTHNDPKDFLSLEKFNFILASCGLKDVSNWRKYWFARYIIMQRGKGVVQNKGYVFSAKKAV